MQTGPGDLLSHTHASPVPKPAVYVYDPEAGTFAAVEPTRRGTWLKGGATIALVLAVVVTAVVSQTAGTPDDGHDAEVNALREQLAEANTDLARFSTELDGLAETDRELYRTVLHARPVSDARRQMGTGGAHDARFAPYSSRTRDLLEHTADTFDRVERRLALQRRSYAELRTAAGRRDVALREQPAILPVRDARMTSGYGVRFHPVLHVMRLHAGVDFGVPAGTPVYARGDGRVSFVGTREGYGTVVEIDHPRAGRMTRFAHLTAAAPGIRVGAAVSRGQVVAASGQSGISTAPHLHYEVRQLDEARTPTDPVETFVPGVTPAEYRALLDVARSRTASLD